MFGLGHFVAAQNGIYPTALAELRAGFKRSHWMWFVFPQIAGLGHSPTAQRYAIRDLAEARAYLAHTILGPRLAETTVAAHAWAGQRTLREIFGPIDALKFVSCMTLFETAATPADATPFATALEALAQGRRDRHTLALLAPENGSPG